MAGKTKVVSMIVLIILGLLIAVWGVLWILMKRRDDKILLELKAANAITPEQLKKVTPSTWSWAMAIVQVVLGVFLIGWGLFQYFSKVEDVSTMVRNGLDDVRNRLSPTSKRRVPVNIE